MLQSSKIKFIYDNRYLEDTYNFIEKNLGDIPRQSISDFIWDTRVYYDLHVSGIWENKWSDYQLFLDMFRSNIVGLITPTLMYLGIKGSEDILSHNLYLYPKYLVVKKMYSDFLNEMEIDLSEYRELCSNWDNEFLNNYPLYD